MMLLLDGVSVNSGGISNPIIVDNLSSGDYTITITDSECEEDVTDTFSITEPEEIIISLDDMMVDLLCFGDSDGWIDVIVSGGVGVYTYLWSNGDSETIMESETIEFSSAVWLNENPGGLNGEIPLVSAIADDLSWSVSTCSYLSSTEVFNGDGTVTVSSVYGSDGGSNTCTLTYPPYTGAISISTVSTHDLSDYSIIGDISFSVIATDFTFSSIGVFSGFHY